MNIVFLTSPIPSLSLSYWERARVRVMVGMGEVSN